MVKLFFLEDFPPNGKNHQKKSLGRFLQLKLSCLNNYGAI